MTHTLQEIESQPQVWRITLMEMRKHQASLEAYLSRCAFSRIFVTGCGSTYYLARSTASFLSLYTPYPVKALPASEAWLLDGSLPSPGTLLLAVSRSGTTTETLRAVEKFRSTGEGSVVVITCYPDSPLAAMGDFVLSAEAAQELSVVQTRSFTSMYLLASAFAYTLGNQAGLLAEMDRLPGLLEDLILDYGDWPLEWADLQRYQKLFFLGSGPNYGLACEAMLKVKEMSLSWAEAYHTLEFRHGPMSLVDENTLVVGLISESMRRHEIEVLADLQKLGSSVVLCDAGQTEGIGWVPEYHVHAHSRVNEWQLGLLVLPLMHRLGYHRAFIKNLNPDIPTNLRAVIEL